MLRVGEKVGGYEIVAKLRSGGMATLFLALKQGASGFRRHVAVKVVHEHLASDPEFIRMFVDEALLQSRIQNPHVVHVEELGEADGNHFLVMEYVHGCSLSQLLQALAKLGRRLTPELSVSIAMQVLAGLHAAHELRGDDGRSLGVVHRDVSPQNVLLSQSGHVKLIDFGVAKARGRATATTGASIKGKLRYMPPEQAMGGTIDRRADVYALGIVLWEVLTMHRLFRGESDLALLDEVRDPHVVAPSTVAGGLSPELDAVVLKALAPLPAHRYASAQEFRRALGEALPRAAMVDPQSIAELLEAVLGDDLERDRRALPASIGAAVGPAIELDTRAEEVVLTMTVSSTGLLSGEGREPGAGPISASGAQPAATEARPAPAFEPALAETIAAPAASALLPAPSPPPFIVPSFPEPAAPQSGGSPSAVAPSAQVAPRWLALAALSVVTLLAAVGWALVGGSRSDEVVATPLASTPRATVVAPPERADPVVPSIPDAALPTSAEAEIADAPAVVAPPPTEEEEAEVVEEARAPRHPTRRPRSRTATPTERPAVPFSTEF